MKNYYIKSVITLLCIYSFTILNAQEKNKSELDSLYSYFISIHNTGSNTTGKPADRNILKCGFALMAQVKSNLEYFTYEQQMVLEKILERPALQSSIVSPSGRFRIHFNESGSDVPNYVPGRTPLENALYAAIAFDSSYVYEVEYLGYPPPPNDNNNGGDDLYDVYIMNIDGYGFTEPESGLGNGKATSFIKIHYSFADVTAFYTHGITALSVTAAHEFHHAIQIGNYILRESDSYFHELTSTSMEEFVFDDANDYYDYMSNYFRNTARPFSKFVYRLVYGYDLAAWNIFLADTLGISIIKRQWELMPHLNALEAIAQSLDESGSSLNEMLSAFGIWCYYTGNRSLPGKYFEEAEAYPLIYPFHKFEAVPPPISANSYPVSNSYIDVVNVTNGFPDTLVIIISNADYKNGVQNSHQTIPFELSLYNYNKAGAIKLTDDYSFDFNADKPFNWSTAGILNGNLVTNNYITSLVVDSPYPSPFYNSIHHKITIPLKSVDYYGGTQLNVYTPAMELIYSAEAKLEKKPGGMLYIEWEVSNNSGNKLPGGVYIYAVRSGDNTTLGKIVIFN